MGSGNANSGKGNGRRGDRGSGWSGGNPSGFRAKHVLAVRMYAARIAWLHTGAPCWEPDSPTGVVYALPDGTRVPLTPEAVARAQYCLNRIAVHAFSARAAFGDADAYLARSRAGLAVAKRLLEVRDAARRPGGGEDPAALASLLLLEAEALCDPPSSPARRLALAGPSAITPLRGVVADDALPLSARALAALSLGALLRARNLADDAPEAAARDCPPAVRAARAFGLRRGISEDARLTAALLAAAGDGASVALAERFAAARSAVGGTPFALPPCLLRELLRRGLGAERCAELLEATAEMLPLADRLRRRRHELPRPPAREDARDSAQGRGLRTRAVRDLGAALTEYVRATGGDPDAVRDFAGFVRGTLDALPRLLGPHLDAALVLPLRGGAKEGGEVARAYLRLLNESGGRLREGAPDLLEPAKRKPGELSERVAAAWEMREWLSRVYGYRLKRVLLLLKASDGDPRLVREALAVNGLGRVNVCADRSESGQAESGERYAWIFRAARTLGVADLTEAWEPWTLLATVADDGPEARARFAPVLALLAAVPAPAAAPLVEALSGEIGDNRAARRDATERLPRLLPCLVRDTVRTAALPGEYEWAVLLYAALRHAPAYVDAVRRRVLREGEAVWRGETSWRAASRMKLALDVASGLCGEDVERGVAVLDAVRAVGEGMPPDDDLRRGLAALARLPGLRGVLADRLPAQQARRCLALVAGVGAVAHLGGGDESLAPLAEFAPEEGFGASALCDPEADPDWAALLDLAPDLAPTVAALWHARWLLGEDAAAQVPAGVRRAALEESRKRQRELDHLEARLSAGGDPNPGIAARVASLRARLADGERMRARAAAEARERLAAALAEAQVAAAERLLDECWRARLNLFLGRGVHGPVEFTEDLRNALLIGVRIDDNRKLLQRLLRAHLAGAARAFLDEHPKNREFEERLAAHGADVGAWRGSHPRCLRLAGTGRAVRLYLETDPLRVLQMGNPFDTCLAADGFNAFSTVANACEANKRVVYAVDEATNRFVGRQLLGLTAEFALLRFRPYTNVETPEEAAALTAAMGAYVADFAARCRLAPADAGTVPTLFAEQWYDDGAQAWEGVPGARRGKRSRRTMQA